MNEDKILEHTLGLLEKEEVLSAYQYLTKELSILDEISSQGYNFLYCLASLLEEKEEALSWLEEAIIDKKIFYRPAVFLDEDLDYIRDDPRFKECVAMSDARYNLATKNAKTVSTWTKKQANNLLLVLHGNQQSNAISKAYWENVPLKDTQVDYIQSAEQVSNDLYRWDDRGDGHKEVCNILKDIPLTSYEKVSLSGFSAGANIILTSILKHDVKVNKIILYAPWMPVLEDHMQEVVQALKDQTIEVLIICGKEDDVSLAQSLAFEQAALSQGVKVMSIYVPNLRHEYTDQVFGPIQGFIENS